MKKNVFIMICFFLFAIGGCAKKECPAIKIGNIGISAEEFEDNFRASRFINEKEAGREKFLEQLISRKLMLEEAEKLGLDKDPRFLENIQLFWEQSLLKLVLSRKIKELSITIEVNDSQIKDYYAKHKEKDYLDKELPAVYDQIKWILFKEKESKAIQDWVVQLKNKVKVEINYGLLGVKQ